MKELRPNGGIPRSTLFAMAVIGGLTLIVPLGDKVSRRKSLGDMAGSYVELVAAIGLFSFQ